MQSMRHLYGLDKQAAQKKQAFAKKLADFMRHQRMEAQQKTAAAAVERGKNNVLAMIRQACNSK